MAKITRSTPKKPGPVAVPDGPVAILDPPEPAESTESAETAADPADDSPEPGPETETVVHEVADKMTLDSRRGRGATKEGSVGFFPRLTKFSPAEWERTMLYVYRLAPITDRMATGNRAKYISKYGQPIDEETILKDHGSGSYRITLNQTDKDGRGICLDRIEIEIENVKYPPVVPIGEWVDDPRNKRWAWARTGANAPPSAHQPAPPAGPTIGELIQGVKSLKELTKEAAPPPAPPAPDPAEQFAKNVESVSKIIEMAKPAPVPAPPAPDNTMEKFLLTELTAERAANRELMGKLLDRANTPAAIPPPDPLKDLAMDLLKKRLEKLDEPTAAEAATERASRMSGNQELTVEIIKYLAPVAEKALTFFTMANTAQAPPPRPAAARPAPTPDAPAVEPPQQQATPTQTDAPPPTAEQLDPRKAVLNFILSYVTPTLLSYLEAGDGEGFASWFCSSSIPIPKSHFPIPGTEAHKFAKQLGRLAIMDAYKTNPDLYRQIAPNTEAEERFIRFLDEFLAYDPDAEQGDAE